MIEKDEIVDNSVISFERLAEGLKLARESRGKTIKECSQILDIPSSRLRNYESGKYTPSLPEIESLSYIYTVPLIALFDPDMLSIYCHEPDSDQLKQLLEIRLRFIAARLKLTIAESGKSYRELSKETSISVSRLKKYENGESTIPLDALNKIAAVFDMEVADFLDKESPIGNWQELQERDWAFNKLPEEIQTFVVAEESQPFISLAQKLEQVGLENFTELSDFIQKVIGSNGQNH